MWLSFVVVVRMEISIFNYSYEYSLSNMDTELTIIAHLFAQN